MSIARNILNYSIQNTKYYLDQEAMQLMKTKQILLKCCSKEFHYYYINFSDYIKFDYQIAV